jgi:hypothetical protein
MLIVDLQFIELLEIRLFLKIIDLLCWVELPVKALLSKLEIVFSLL